MAYNRKDRFFKKAKEEGFRSRAAYKLQEISKTFKILKPGLLVLDVGCAPGSWLQVISKEVGQHGKVIGVDLEPISHFSQKNIIFIEGDIREEITVQRILHALGRKVDVVVSDMAPHLSGIKFQDHYNSYELALQALQLCHLVLKEGGNFVTKIFPGEDLETLKQKLKESFAPIKEFIPGATRKTSTELYLVAKGFKNGRQKMGKGDGGLRGGGLSPFPVLHPRA